MAHSFCCAVVAFVATEKHSRKRKGQTAVSANSCRAMLLLRNE